MKIDKQPQNTQSEKTTRRFVFVALVRLVIRTRLMDKMREPGLIDKYSVELLLLQMDTLRMISLADGQVFKTDVTKK